MREWIPTPGSTKAKLVEVAMGAFGSRGYEGVGVTELAQAAGVTTGALYHHFGNKLGLYGVVRDEMERRILDRMEGAAEAVSGDRRAAVRAALLVGFDAAVRFGAARMLGEPDPRGGDDPLVPFLGSRLPGEPRPVAHLLTAAWRAALRLAAEDGAGREDLRAALAWMLGEE